MTELGRLEKVDLRNAWATETSHFTPWLAGEENIRLLGKTIGLELEVQVTEKEVGPFRADILCKDLATGNWVLIENQLERTDHLHLGQLLTYAAGLDAVTIIWIAQHFTPEHRAALDWLNDITREGVSFFGLEIELWRIADSPLAPKFNIISKPNEWSRAVKESADKTGLSDSQEVLLDFWAGLQEHLAKYSAIIRPAKPQPQSFVSMALGRGNTRLVAVASSRAAEVRAEVAMHGATADLFYRTLKAQKESIERELGEELNWYDESEKKRRIFLRRDADLDVRNRWPEYFAWLQEKLEKLHCAFSKRIKAIDTDEYEANHEQL